MMKRYEDLDITDNFMFAKVFSHKDIAKDFLQDILFICPDDIFGKGKSVYSFQNRDDSDPNILMGDLCYKNFYIFKKYSAIEDAPTREYMQYFATKKSGSEKIERIEKLVENYRQDPITKKAYMTLE